MNNTKRSLTLIATAIMLTACGGGGGGGDSGNGNAGAGNSGNTNNGGNNNSGGGNTTVSAAPITAQNYEAVAQEALNSSNYLLNTAQQLPIGVQANLSQNLLATGEAQAQELLKRFGKSKAVAIGASYTETEACPSGGTLTYSENDRNGNEMPDAGDSVSITASNCNMGGGVTMNGTLGMVVSAFSGNLDSFPFKIQASLTYDNFSITAANTKATGNGTAEITLNANSARQISTAIRTDRLTMTATNAGVQMRQSLVQYQATSSMDSSLSSASVDGTVESSNLADKSIRIATPTKFTVDASRGRYPYQGEMVVTGANKSAVRLKAIDANSFQIELDADGDGSYEVKQTKSWSSIL